MKPVTLWRKMIGVFLDGQREICTARGLALLLIAHADELSGLASFIWVDDRDLVGDNTNGEACVSCEILSFNHLARLKFLVLPMMCAHAVMMFGPYFGLNTDRRESSTSRRRTSLMSNGFRISGFTRERRSSTGYRGASGSIKSSLGGVRTWSEATHSRAFWIASNLKYESVLAVFLNASMSRTHQMPSNPPVQSSWHGLWRLPIPPLQ